MDKKVKTHASSDSRFDVRNVNKKRKLKMKGTRGTDSESGYSGDEYEVSKILDRRIVNGKVEYLLLWAGFGLDESTWEGEENLFCTKLLKEFNLQEATKERSNSSNSEHEFKVNDTIDDSNTTIDTLPPEIKREIFKQIESKTELRLVCSQWKNQVDGWFYSHNGILTDDSVSFIRSSSLQFDTITVQNLHKDLSGENPTSTKSRSRSGLALNPRKLVYSSAKDSPVSSTSVSSENIELLLRLNADIKSLVFDHCVFSDTKINLFGFYFPNLTELEITFNRNSVVNHQKTVFYYISRFKLPSLTTMRINVEENTDSYHQLYIDIYELITSCHKSLKNLDVSFHSYHVVPKVNNPLPLSASRLALLRRDLFKIRLECLCISLDDFDEPENKNLALLLLSSQNTLKNLEIRFHVAQFCVVAPAVKNTIEKNISSLVNLTFRRCFCSIPYDGIPEANLEANLLCSMFKPLMSNSPHQTKLGSLCVYGIPPTLVPSPSSTFINLSNLPPSLKSLKLAGYLDLRIFQAFASYSNGYGKPCLPLLEELVIFNLDRSRENYTIGKGYVNKILNTLPMLKLLKIYWCTNYFDLKDFEGTKNSLKIEIADSSWNNWHFKRKGIFSVVFLV